MKKLIIDVEKDGIGEELGVEPMDKLVSINGTEIVDVFDYRIAVSSADIELLIEKPDGEEWLLSIEKDEDEELGLVFESGLMDKERPCANNCVFCFIHQNPAHMRQTIYFRDDDYRLSYLHGNYITMTNMDEADVDRILKYRLSPMNISVHTTDQTLRVEMMDNKDAGGCLEYLKRLACGGISLNMQIVLCKGYNDGAALDKTIYDLGQLAIDGKGGDFSLSVVPAGLTKYREQNCLPHIEPFGREDCLTVIGQVERWQRKFLEDFGSGFVYAADEFYVKAGATLPPYEDYEDFPQIENGVGMMAAFGREFYDILEKAKPRDLKDRRVTVITGLAAYEFMKEICSAVEKRFVGIKIDVIVVKNSFFGENVTVAGLLTGQDIIAALKGRSLGDMILIPTVCMRAGEEVFLDDVTLEDIGRELSAAVAAVNPVADEFLDVLIRGCGA